MLNSKYIVYYHNCSYIDVWIAVTSFFLKSSKVFELRLTVKPFAILDIFSLSLLRHWPGKGIDAGKSLKTRATISSMLLFL